MREQEVTGALRHWGAAFGLALQFTGDRGRAEDLCQEAFLRLCRAPRPLDLSRSLRGYLLAIVRNLAASESRRRGAPPPLAPGADEEALADPRASDPAAASAKRESIAAVRHAMDALSPTWRAVLYLRDGLDLPSAEVAAILDTTEETVRVTLHRARRKLRGSLSGLERYEVNDGRL